MPEELVLFHCSPTLAGLKTGNLFGYKYDDVHELMDHIRVFNHTLSCKGVRMVPLKIDAHRALIYVYRPKKLRQDLTVSSANKLLQESGYPCGQPEKCVSYLSRKLRNQSDFPHEIGLFLGYPPEDVRGFIEQGPQNCKCCGCWKVYGDEESAKKQFALYKKCTDLYMRQWQKGKSVERLTVAV